MELIKLRAVDDQETTLEWTLGAEINRWRHLYLRGRQKKHK